MSRDRSNEQLLRKHRQGTTHPDPYASQSYFAPKGRTIQGEGRRTWAVLSWAALAVRVVMFLLVVLCIVWIPIKWSCTLDQIADVENTSFLAARTRTEKAWQAWLNETSKSLASNFSELNVLSGEMIHQLTEKVSLLQKNLTELIRAQEQAVIAISYTNNNTVATLSKFDVMLSTQVRPIGKVVDEDVTALKGEVEQYGKSQKRLIMDVSKTCGLISDEMLSLDKSTWEALLTLQQLNETVPRNLLQHLVAVSDSEMALATVAQQAEDGLQKTNTAVSQTHEVLETTVTSLKKQVLGNVTSTVKAYQAAVRAIPGLIQEIPNAATETKVILFTLRSWPILSCQLAVFFACCQDWVHDASGYVKCKSVSDISNRVGTNNAVFVSLSLARLILIRACMQWYYPLWR